ncbi:histidine kinase [Saccharopolyspora cebuensis]
MTGRTLYCRGVSYFAGTSPAPTGRLRRFVDLLRDQWVFAGLLGLLWCGEVLLAVEAWDGAVALIPGNAALVLLAIVARVRPVQGGMAAAVVLVANTGVVALTDPRLYSVGLEKILVTENAAGMLIVLYLFRSGRISRAIPVTAVLVLSCLGSIALRRAFLGSEDHPVGTTFALGFLQLVLAVGTGLYLRRTHPWRPDAPLLDLLRRQWPATAALVVLLFLEFVSTAFEGVVPAVIGMSGGVVLAGLAIIAPARPVQAAALGALAVVTFAVSMRTFGIEPATPLVGDLSPSIVASGMLLVAYVTRYAEPRQATWCGAGLVGAALFAMVVIPPSYLSGMPASLFMGALLLIISVSTGMYFRARDGERLNSVQSAIASAQQEERMALARELHDVVAHHVTGIVVQAQAAHLVAEKNPQAATEALARISDSGTEALTAMRRLVASMRGAESGGTTELSDQATTDLAADLEALVESTIRRVAGDHASTRFDLQVDLAEPVPPEVSRSALRIVQESLTNAEKHAADATVVQIDVRSADDELRIKITDDGRYAGGPPVGGSGGYGLVGMRERIELLGGRFYAGPGEHVGWRVEVSLPLAELSGTGSHDDSGADRR